MQPRVLLWSLCPCLAAAGVVTYVPPDPACTNYDMSLWSYTVTPSDAVLSATTNTLDKAFNGDGSFAKFKNARRDLEFVLDLGQTIDQTSHSIVLQAIVWSHSRISAWEVQTSEDGVTWTNQFTMGASPSSNYLYPETMCPDRSVRVRYIKHIITNGRYSGGTGWGMREFNTWDCGPLGWPRPITTTTLTVTTTTVRTTSVTKTTSTVTTATATTSTVTTVTTTQTTSTRTTSTATTVTTKTSTSSSSTTSQSSTSSSTLTTTTTSTTVSTTSTLSSSTSTTKSTSSTTSRTSTTSTSSSTSSSSSSVTSSSTSSSSSTSTTTTTTTSSSTSTSTSSSSSTSTTTSTTTTATEPADVRTAPDLLDFSTPYMNSFVQELVHDVQNREEIWARFPATPMVTFNLRRGRDTLIRVAQSDATLLVPSTVLDVLDLDEAKGVVAAFEPHFTRQVGGRHLTDGLEIESLNGCLNILIYNSTGGLLKVNDTGGRPIEMTLQANRSSDIVGGRQRECAFWDEEKLGWSDVGLNSSNNTEGLLTCATNHLTLFAAIVRGFINALLCSQFTLLSREGIAAMRVQGWASQPTAIIYWLFLVSLGALLLVALAVDRSFPGWTDDVFLIPLHDAAEEEEEAPPPPKEPLLQRVKGCCVAPFLFLFESSVCRDAMDEFCSRWFAYFGEARGLCESICEHLSCGSGGEGGSSRRRGLVASGFEGAAAALVANSSRRQASATLGVSGDVMDFLLDDEDLNELLSAEQKQNEEMKTDDMEDGGIVRSVKTNRGWTRKVELWRDLHQQAVNEIDMHWACHGWRALPSTIVRFFVVTNPLVAMFLSCYFYSRTLRVLLFIVEMCSATMVASVFFDASGMSTNRRSAPECSDTDDPGEIIGQLILVGLVSWAFGSIPALIIETLHSRSFKKLPFQGCPEWQHQLRVWMIQDVALWIFAALYCGWCIFFTSLFLANVLPEELPSWGYSNVFALVQDEIVVPFVIAVVVPPLAAMCLALAAKLTRQPSSQVLEDQRLQKAQTGNWSRSLSMGPKEI